MPTKPTIESIIHKANCVNPTKPIPITLPIISWKGLTLDTITSTMRDVFSSDTPLITCEPKVRTTINMTKPSTRPMADFTSVKASLPVSISLVWSFMRVALTWSNSSCVMPCTSCSMMVRMWLCSCSDTSLCKLAEGDEP